MDGKYFLDFEAIHPKCLIKIMNSESRPKGGFIWELTNELKPIDLYCYLYAKYGIPNGLQNIFRNDDSNNLIHWEWALVNQDGILLIQGQNFRTEIHLLGGFKEKPITVEQLIDELKSDFKNFGKAMSAIRLKFEKWTEFVNPYQRIRSAVESHITKLDELNLSPALDKVPQPITEADFQEFGKRWGDVSEKYSFGIGLTFGLRAMLPVLAESFVNLLIFVLARKEIKENDRLLSSVIKQNIDIRVQSLHLNCIGFDKPVDYSAQQCKDFHSLMNERNDMLHGNVDVNRLSFGEVYFDRRTVPIFTQYEDAWQKSIGISLNSVKFNEITSDYAKIDAFIEYLKDHLQDQVKLELNMMTKKSQLGFNKKTNRIGILFPEHLADFRAFGKTAPNEEE